MKNIKDFQTRYERWKKGERYWDIRGVDLPRYDEAEKQTTYGIDPNGYYLISKDGANYRVNPNVATSDEITVTTPEIEVVAQRPAWMIDTSQFARHDYLREGGTSPTSVDQFVDKNLYSSNPLMSGLARSIEDWRTDRSPIRAAMRNFGWWNPIISSTSAVLDHRLGTESNAPQLMIPQMIQDYGNKYSAALHSLYHLTSDDGLKKTKRYFDELYQSNPFEGDYSGKFWNTVASGIGDLFDATLLKNGVKAVSEPFGAIAKDVKIRLKNNDAIRQFNEDYVGGAYRRYKDVKNGNTPYRIMYVQKGLPNTVMEPSANSKLLNGPNYRQLVPPKKTVVPTNELPSSGQTFTPPLSFRQLVDEKGNINTKEAIRALRQLSDDGSIDLAQNKYGHKHKREDLSRRDVYMPTLRHLQLTAKFAQKAPLPEGLTRQQFVLAALTHDIGELQNRDLHPSVSAKIVGNMYPDTPWPTRILIKDHMTLRNPIKSDAAKALHMADVANLQTFEEAERQFPYLRYNYPGRPTLIGTTKHLDTKAQLERLNPVMEMYGYEAISDKLSDSEVRKEVLRRLQHINTFGRGVRMPLNGEVDLITGRGLYDIAKEEAKLQFGRTPTNSEIATDMVSRIGVPETENGVAGRSNFFNAIGANEYNFNTLYTSNSSETSSGYGGSGDIRYESYPKIMKRPVEDNPEYNLIDLWLANDFPLYDQKGGPLHKEYDRVTPAYLSGALKPSDVKLPSFKEQFEKEFGELVRRNNLSYTSDYKIAETLSRIQEKWPGFKFPTDANGEEIGQAVIEDLYSVINHIDKFPGNIGFEGAYHYDGNADVRQFIGQLKEASSYIAYHTGKGKKAEHSLLNKFYKNIPALSLYKKLFYDKNIEIPIRTVNNPLLTDDYSPPHSDLSDSPSTVDEIFHSQYGTEDYDVHNAARLMDTIERRLKSKRTPKGERKLLEEFYDQIPDGAKTDESFISTLTYDLSKFLRERIKDSDVEYTFNEIIEDINWGTIYRTLFKKAKQRLAIRASRKAKEAIGDVSNIADNVDTYEMNQLQETMNQPLVFTTERLRPGNSRNNDSHQHYVFVGPRGMRIFPNENVTDDVRINTGRTSSHKRNSSPYLSPKLRNLIIPITVGGYATNLIKQNDEKTKR